MLAGLIVAAAAALLQPGPGEDAPTAYTVFDRDAEGWTVVRRTDGCFVFREFDERGDAGVSVYYNVDRAEEPLAILFHSKTWTVRNELAEGYDFELTGTASHWRGISVRTFNGDEGDAVVALPFARAATAPLLADFARASGLSLSRGGQTLARVELRGNAAAIRRLADCVATFPRGEAPAPPAPDRAPPAPR